MLFDPVGTSKTKSMCKEVYLEFIFSIVESVEESEKLKQFNNF